MTRPLSRRTMLRGAGGLALALPFLGAMEARAASTGPRRFIAFWHPNGTVPEQFWPTGGETNFTLSPVLKPLEPWREHLLILDGLVHRPVYGGGPGDAHTQSIGGVLTGRSLSGNGIGDAYGGGISVDQEIANNFASKVTLKRKSLELGVGVDVGTPWGRMVLAGPRQPLPPENDPARVFDALFANFTPPTGTVDPAVTQLRLEQRSILDAVLPSYRRLEGKLGGADKQKLDQHLTSLRELEASLFTAAPADMSCEKPNRPASTSNFANAPVYGPSQLNLIAKAFACDLTRVATIQWSRAAANHTYPWKGLNRSHHDLSHNGGVKTPLAVIDNWYSEQLAALMKMLFDIKEPNGTALDNTVILMVNEHGEPHSNQRLPVMLAGGKNCGLRSGRYLKFNNVPHNNVLVSCLNAMGIGATTFGTPGFCTGQLSGLT